MLPACKKIALRIADAVYGFWYRIHYRWMQNECICDGLAACEGRREWRCPHAHTVKCRNCGGWIKYRYIRCDNMILRLEEFFEIMDYDRERFAALVGISERRGSIVIE